VLSCPSAEKRLDAFAKEVVIYHDIPANADEMALRIGDADAVLLSYTSMLGQEKRQRRYPLCQLAWNYRNGHPGLWR